MDIYHYDENTGELLGLGEAQPDPLEPGRWLVPRWATDIKPPAKRKGKLRCFTGTAWEYRDEAAMPAGDA
jgi:hypothetical protein